MAGEGNSDLPPTDFSSLPEECTAHILSLTTPPDACRLSLVSRTFKSAADSDVVWENFLPSDYQNILSRSSTPVSYDSKKELFFRLCEHPILIDEGRKSFSLEKWNGAKCYMLAARDITIIWGSTPQYWSWISHPDSRFPEVASLNIVWWLEIRGNIRTAMLSQRTNYAAYLVYKLVTEGRRHYYGFRSHPMEVSVHISGEEKHVQNVCLDPHFDQEEDEDWWDDDEYDQEYLSRLPQPKKREDEWFEIELGEYFTRDGEDLELIMEVLGVKGGVAKSGLIIQGIEIRPKKNP